MTTLPLTTMLLAGGLMLAPPTIANAQDTRQRIPPSGESTVETGRAVARARARGESPDVPPSPAPVATAPVAAAPPDPAPRAPAEASRGDEGQAKRRDGRRRGDNPATGRAVPRPQGARGEPDRRAGRGGGSGRVVVVPRYGYSPYYYSRRAYPYGYGAFGLGYFYYDPYAWPYAADPYVSGDRRYAYDIGHLRLDVKPREAEVFVDGYFAGRVDDFDGRFQSLDLEAGPYRIEIRAPGYETLAVDIRVLSGRKTTYRGDLRRIR